MVFYCVKYFVSYWCLMQWFNLIFDKIRGIFYSFVDVDFSVFIGVGVIVIQIG